MSDPNRFARDYPNSLEPILKAAGVEAGDLWVLAVRKAESKQSSNQFFQTCGHLRLDLAQKYAAKHGAFAKTGDPAKDFRFLWVTDFPMFEWDQRVQALERGPSSVYFAARRGHGQARDQLRHDQRSQVCRWEKSARWPMT